MKIEKWSWAYAFFKPYVKLIHCLVQSNVIINGLENIPKNKPIIFAPNHQNALLDSLAIILTTPYQPVWLARADIFKNKIVAKLLHFFKMTPVYRIRDGKEQLNKNNDVFDLCIRILEHNGQLALFPEGTHSGMRKSLPHQKAVPRIAFLAAEKHQFGLDIQIVPVGIYYSDYNKSNRYTMVNYGKPIALNSYKTLYEQSPQGATMELRNAIFKEVLDLSIEIPSRSLYDEYEMLRAVLDKPIAIKKNAKLTENVKFTIDREMLETVKSEETNNPEWFSCFMGNVTEYKNALSELNIKDDVLEQPPITVFHKIGYALLFAGIFPLVAYGAILHFIPFTLPRYIVRKKVKDPVFVGTFDIVLSIVLLSVFYFIYALLIQFIFHSGLVTLLVLITLPMFGKLSYNMQQRFIHFRKKIGFQTQLKQRKTKALRAVQLRNTIIQQYFEIQK